MAILSLKDDYRQWVSHHTFWQHRYSRKNDSGENCNISHGVTLGIADRGKNEGGPTIGDNVYIGPGAKIIGNVTVGNYAAIGANAAVTKDIPEME